MTEHPLFFTRENRTRFFQLLTKLFPPAHHDWEGLHGGDQLIALEEMATYRLGKLPLAHGNGILERFRNFIETAPEGDIYAIIELMPAAQNYAMEKIQREIGAPFPPADPTRQLRQVIATMNHFFEDFGSLSRFREDGKFDSSGFVNEKPRTLLALPSRDSLNEYVAVKLTLPDPVGVIFIDLDNFKQVNERYGHKEGDRCLEEAVRLIYSVATGRGKVYRYGKDAGDEFVVVMRNADASECSASGSRIRLAVEKAKLGGDVGVTVSVGVASSDSVGLDSAAKLIEAADEAARISKHTGKNRVTVWPPTEEQVKVAEENGSKTSR